jgi:hypothetical protein
MALSDIILGRDEAVLTAAGSTLGILSAGTALNFGVVAAVNQLSDKTVVGSNVRYDNSKATPFMIDGDTENYLLVNESDLSFQEPPAM